MPPLQEKGVHGRHGAGLLPPRLYVNWRFMRGIEAQFLALQKGFNELIPQHLLKPFDQKELEVGTWCNSSLGCE